MRHDDPAAPDPGEPAGVELQSSDPAPGHAQPRRLLLVEDDVRFADLVPVRLGVATYHPGGPESLEELLEQARHDLRPVHA